MIPAARQELVESPTHRAAPAPALAVVGSAAAGVHACRKADKAIVYKTH